MREIVRWIARNPWTLFAFGLGGLFGVLIRWPTGWVLPSPNAELVGGAVGAIIAIGGTMLVWRIQEHTRIDRLVTTVVNNVLVGIGYLGRLAKVPIEDSAEAMRLAGLAKKHVTRARADIFVFQSDMTTVSPVQSRTFRMLQYGLESIGDELERATTAAHPNTAQLIELGQRREQKLSEYCKALLEDRAPVRDGDED